MCTDDLVQQQTESLADFARRVIDGVANHKEYDFKDICPTEHKYLTVTMEEGVSKFCQTVKCHYLTAVDRVPGVL